MRKRILIAALALAAILVPATAIAQTAHTPKSLRHAYLKRYHKVAREQGKRAPGRNVVNSGTASQLRRSIDTLDRMLAPAPTPQPSNGGTEVQTSAPASSSSGGGGGGGFAACIRQRENSGSYSGSDGPYSGAYQFDSSTWSAAWGGHPPTATAGEASPAQQDQAFQRWYPGHPTAWPNTGPACGG